MDQNEKGVIRKRSDDVGHDDCQPPRLITQENGDGRLQPDNEKHEKK
jgi:hypothetical protein